MLFVGMQGNRSGVEADICKELSGDSVAMHIIMLAGFSSQSSVVSKQLRGIKRS
jgi:hypothetical protein